MPDESESRSAPRVAVSVRMIEIRERDEFDTLLMLVEHALGQDWRSYSAPKYTQVEAYSIALTCAWAYGVPHVDVRTVAGSSDESGTRRILRRTAKTNTD